ncbi:MAG: Dyp-type peroxidase, partial [Streptosporangiales bacterium]
HKGSGAPFGGQDEHDRVVPPKLPPRSHVRLAHPRSNGGVRILRRGYSFVDGSDDLGRLKAGLFFIVFDRDPREQFIPLQRRLTEQETMNEYVEYVAQGIWACPAGVRAGGCWGERLFA